MRPYTKKEAYKLLREYGTPKHVVEHCEVVADTAIKIATKLNDNGYNLDLALIQAAGLLHDIARVNEPHAEIGANYLKALGHNKEAGIVRQHMTYSEFNSPENINETDIVCIADRVCKENKYVGIDERMAYILKKHEGFPERQKIIMNKKEELKKYIKKLEKILGYTLDELIK